MAQTGALRDGLIGPDVGLMPGVRARRVRPDSISAPALSVYSPQLPSFLGVALDAQTSTGFGIGAQKLFGSAAGEFIERYSAAVLPEQFAAADEGEKIPAERFVQFTEAQYSNADFRYHHPNTVQDIHYVRAFRPANNSVIKVPADLCYLTPSSSSQWCTMTSNGLAAGRSFATAARAAIFELIERDAFMRAWYQRTQAIRLALPATVPQHFSPELRAICAQLKVLGVSVNLIRLSGIGGIPVVLSCARSADVGLAVGCAAKPTVQEAITSALIESVHTYNWARQIRDRELDENQIATLTDHIALHAKLKNRPLNNFLDSGPEVSEQEFIAGGTLSLSQVLAITEAAGWDVLLADLRSPDVAANGWHVVRALSPQAATLDVDVPHLAQHPTALHQTPHPFP